MCVSGSPVGVILDTRVPRQLDHRDGFCDDGVALILLFFNDDHFLDSIERESKLAGFHSTDLNIVIPRG